MIAGRPLLAIAVLIAAGVPGYARDERASSHAGSAEDRSFADRCAGAGSLLPPGAVLQTVETVDPAFKPWRSPPSLATQDGEQVRVPFCRLAGAIDGDIGFEIWLPRDWNSRLMGTGVGGEAGYFNYFDMTRGIEQGFVTASSDTGHKRGEPWIDNPRKAENYSHIAYHRLTEVTKAVTNAFYGSPASYSYFLGCSGGGRQGLRELRLYPGDYDGAVIGAPGLDVPLLAARLLHVHLSQTAEPGAELTENDWNLISGSATAQCDAQDGVPDGVIDDPRKCGFKVRELECRPGQSENCLTPAKLRAAEAVIAPLRDSSGRSYDYGLLPGITARPGGLPPLPVQMFGGVVRQDPHWDPRTFDIASDLPAARAAFQTMDARDADLSAFADRGGKLILFHGWADASVQPESTIDFFDRLNALSGGTVSDFARLYMVPGMQHCRGGAGTDRFGAGEDRYVTAQPGSDMLAALIAWVEHGAQPGVIEARRLDAQGKVDRTRPLCPWPQVASYRGSGSVDDARNFTCTDLAAASLRTGGGR